MQRICIEDQPQCGFAGCGEISSHAATHRPTGENHGTTDLGCQEVAGRTMGTEQERLGVGSLPIGLRVQVVESENSQPSRGKTVSQFDQPGVILIRPGPMGQ
jgi:hypothetical protein